MDTISMDRLRPIGFTLRRRWRRFGMPMRLIEVHRYSPPVTDGASEHSARPLPGLLRSLADTDAALTVGDWLLGQYDAHGGTPAAAPANASVHANRAAQFFGRAAGAGDQRRYRDAGDGIGRRLQLASARTLHRDGETGGHLADRDSDQARSV